MNERERCCPNCGRKLTVQEILEMLRPEGYVNTYKVESFDSRKLTAYVEETQINPWTMRVVEAGE